MAFFCYIVYELLVGLATAAAQEADPEIRGKIQTAQVMTVISWCTYPVVCFFPMLRIDAAADLSGMKEDLEDTKEPLAEDRQIFAKTGDELSAHGDVCGRQVDA